MAQKSTNRPFPACHVIGAGLSGLSAASRLAAAGFPVHLYEAASHAGGRCRSMVTPRWGATIDNGSHLMFTANQAVRDFLTCINAPSTSLQIYDTLDFVDLANGQRWQIRPKGHNGLWAFGKGLRIPGAPKWRVMSDLWRLLLSRPGHTVTDRISTEAPAWRKVWQPFIEAVFNAPPSTVSAPHAAIVLHRLLAHGADSACPMVAVRPWSEIIAEPAIAHLQRNGATVNFNMPLLSIERGASGVRRLLFRSGTIDAGNDYVVLAIPNANARRLCPDLVPDMANAPILNLHFKMPMDLGTGMTGVVGGISDWIFWRGQTIAVTVGAPQCDLNRSRDDLHETIWNEVITALPQARLSAVPPCRRIIEKRATFDASPQAFACRPDTRTPHDNLFLAGDWTNTGLPATMEGAVCSGEKAARAILDAMHQSLHG